MHDGIICAGHFEHKFEMLEERLASLIVIGIRETQPEIVHVWQAHDYVQMLLASGIDGIILYRAVRTRVLLCIVPRFAQFLHLAQVHLEVSYVVGLVASKTAAAGG